MKKKPLFRKEPTSQSTHFARNLLLPALMLVVIASPTAVQAAQYRWTISGNISTMTTGFWDNSVDLGTPLTVSMLIDTSSAPIRVDDFGNGGGKSFYSVSEFSVTFGSYSLGADPGFSSLFPYAGVLNDLPVGQSLIDGYDWQYDPLHVQYGLSNLDVSGELYSSTNLFNSETWVPPQSDLSTYNYNNVIGVWGNITPDDYSSPSRQYVSAIVTSSSVEAVPEPSNAVAAFLVMSGAALLFQLQRRRQQHRGVL